MSFSPGKVVARPRLKDGKRAVIRYPKWEDWEGLWEYINELSQEDTFVTFSGEKISKEEEISFLASWFKLMTLGNGIFLVAVVDKKIAGMITVTRHTGARERQKHVAGLGMSVRKRFRGKGLGKSLLDCAVQETKKNMKGIKMIVLSVFSNNIPAISLYQKLGFKEYGRLKKGLLYKGKFVDEIEMVLYL